MKFSTNYERLIANLDYLNLNQMKLHLDTELNKKDVSLIDGLLRLTDTEVDHKRINAANQMVKVANFPHLKTIENFDFNFNKDINENQVRLLNELNFLEKKENIIFLGNSGVGKTHLAVSIGIESAKRRYSTYFIKCNDLINNLKKANLENRLEARIKHYAKYKLLIIDELGYLPLNKGDERLLFQLIDKRYENKSTIVTTNINFEEWGDLFYDDKIAAAILDRLLHHSTIVTIVGQSYRLKEYIFTKED